MRPLREETWSVHFCAVGFVMGGTAWVLTSVYLGSSGTRAAFRRLDWLSKYTPRVLLGGNFNCTQFETLDMSLHVPGSNHFSKALQHILGKLGLVDAFTTTMPNCDTEGEVAAVRAEQHIYHYTTANGEPASSRLDRLYTTVLGTYSSAGTEVRRAAGHSDHDGFLLRTTDLVVAS